MFNKKLILFFVLFAISAFASPEPQAEPEAAPGTCEIPRRSPNNCRRMALELCGPGMTASLASCRSIAMNLCSSEAAVNSVSGCLDSSCNHLKARGRNHPREEMIEKCHRIKPLCQERVCQTAQPLPVVREVAPEELKKWDNPPDAPKGAEPAPEAKPEPTCEVPRRSPNNCRRMALELCGPGMTASLASCRSIAMNLCSSDAAVDSVEGCLNSSCNHLKARGRHHPREEMIEKCHRIKPLCKERVCQKAQPLPVVREVAPEELKKWDNPPDAPKGAEPAPEAEPEPTCVIRPRSKSECQRASLRACGDCVTNKCGACRVVFEKFCMAPEPVASVDACIADRCAKKRHTSRMKASKQINWCKQKLRGQCAEHVCGNAQPLGVENNPEPEPTCRMPERSPSDCKRFALESCGPGMTASLATCRSIHFNLCTDPKPQKSVESCLRSKCDHLKARGRGHPAHEMRAKCRRGVVKMCQQLVCEGAPEPANDIVRVPEAVLDQWKESRTDLLRKVRAHTDGIKAHVDATLATEKKRLHDLFKRENARLNAKRAAFRAEAKEIMDEVKIQAARKPPILVVPPIPCDQKCPTSAENLIKKIAHVNGALTEILATLKKE